LAYESRQCPGCRSYDSLVPLEKELRHVTWEDGSKIEVVQYRCRVCASVDTIRRDVSEAHKDVKTVTGHAAWSDGRMYAGHSLIENEEA
jgi:hypothetical protein